MKFIKEIHALLLTLAGTALVLITLSGTVRLMAFWITVVTLAMHFMGMFFDEKE